jgi:hypothetical protein
LRDNITGLSSHNGQQEVILHTEGLYINRIVFYDEAIDQSNSITKQLVILDLFSGTSDDLDSLFDFFTLDQTSNDQNKIEKQAVILPLKTDGNNDIDATSILDLVTTAVVDYSSLRDSGYTVELVFPSQSDQPSQLIFTRDSSDDKINLYLIDNASMSTLFNRVN